MIEFLCVLILIEVAMALATWIVFMLHKIRELDHRIRGLPHETPPNTGR